LLGLDERLLLSASKHRRQRFWVLNTKHGLIAPNQSTGGSASGYSPSTSGGSRFLSPQPRQRLAQNATNAAAVLVTKREPFPVADAVAALRRKTPSVLQA
jgi:hypothetical protein